MSGPPNPPGSSNNSAVWAAKADTDLRGAEILAMDPNPPWDLICYHAQQAAEKYLKAVLVAQGQQPPKVHDLSKLLTSAMAFDASLVNLSQDAVSLTPYAIDSRYPDSLIVLTAVDGNDALAAARRIRAAIQHLI